MNSNTAWYERFLDPPSRHGTTPAPTQRTGSGLGVTHWLLAAVVIIWATR